MTQHQLLLQQFYEAFTRLDGEAMASCYHPEARFEDPAFGQLSGKEAGEMWKMLCHSQKGKDFVVRFSDTKADEDKGTANWEAEYTFSQTGRRVHNKIKASFIFKDGLIYRHIDDFDFYKWSRQALGLPGYFLGWTPLLKNKIQTTTRKMLAKWMER